MKKRILSLILCFALCLGMVSMLAACGKKDEGGNGAKADAFVIATELLDGLFNPFYYTSANDGTIVGMTQISLIGAAYENGSINVAYGENEAVVAKDYEIVENADGTVSYYFVLKNGILYSDGHPLTMEDVLFNFYVYLDPVYTGSNTLYSTDILGLDAYRTQSVISGGGNNQIASQAATRAANRINELIGLFQLELKASPTKTVTQADMEAAIKSHTLSSGYIEAISNNPSEVTYENLLADYHRTLELFREELNSDYASAQESFTDDMYKADHIKDYFKDEVFCFMFFEGYVGVEYNTGADGKIDRSSIKSLTPLYGSNINTKEAAIEYVYTNTTTTQLDYILSFWATAGTLESEYVAKATEVILRANVSADGSLLVPSIEGLVSLGHTEAAGSKITVNGTEYTIASGHNADGTVTNSEEYDILKITIDGVDPKAIWNFALSVAPQHYYGEGSSVGMDIANNKFGVEYASFDFMSKVIQSTRNVKLPMGAGCYKVTDASSSDSPSEGGFYNSNVVYFKANTNFNTVGEGINNPKINLIRYQVVSSNNMIDALQTGAVHYINPALTADNYDKLENMKSSGYVSLSTKQLGYGYIGINASKVNDMYLRRAIMCAMNTALAISYYRSGTAEQIFWNMSKVSWAYPTGAYEKDNGKDYPQMGSWDESQAIANIQKYMDMADYTEADLKLTFTIAGSTTDHPCYTVLEDAAKLLNSQGWDISVVCDTNALTKISTGSLTVWAAAWSSSLDPDMYQVYHKDSTATSVKAWGYDYLLKSGSSEELNLLDKLSDVIDAARETNNQGERAELYQEAMGYILDLAFELPVYQRSTLYAYNANVLNKNSMPAESELNPFSNPLDRIWEIEFAG